MNRVTLGTWTLASGNARTLSYAAMPSPAALMAWDRVPLTRVEVREYLERVQPEMLRPVMEYREDRPSTLLVVTVL